MSTVFDHAEHRKLRKQLVAKSALRDELREIRCAAPHCRRSIVSTTRHSHFCSQHKYLELSAVTRDLRVTVGTETFEAFAAQRRLELKEEAASTVVRARQTIKRARSEEEELDALLFPSAQPQRIAEPVVEAPAAPIVERFESPTPPPIVVRHFEAPAAPIFEPFEAPAPKRSKPEEARTGAVSAAMRVAQNVLSVAPFVASMAQLAFRSSTPAPIPGLLALPGNAPLASAVGSLLFG